MKFKAYFQNELNYLHDAGNEFSRLTPRLAKYLAQSSSDPDIAKLMEGFAFLTGRLRQTLDDELSGLTQSVLRMLWPGFLRPFPPIAMLKFTPSDRAITTCHRIEAGMTLRSEPKNGHVFQFNTTSHCDIYPLELTSTRLERTRDRSTLFMSFSTLSGLPLSDIKLQSLRLWLIDSSQVADTLYLWMRNYLKSTRISGHNQDARMLPPHCVQPSGFDPSEALLPGSAPAFNGYRLLQEYFAFPQKFRCLDLVDIAPFFTHSAAKEFILEFHFDRPIPTEAMNLRDIFKLYCTPIVNLCDETAIPFQLNEGENRYPIAVADSKINKYEIFSVKNVRSWADAQRRTVLSEGHVYPRFESFTHEIEHARQREQIYYREHMIARQSAPGFDITLSFVRHDGTPAPPISRHVGAEVICFHPDAHNLISPGDVVVPTQQAPSFATYTNISVPTKPLFPAFEDAAHWRLISNLSQNVADMADIEALKEILKIYDFPRMNDRTAEHASTRQLNGLQSIVTKPVDRIFQGHPLRGVQSTIVLKASAFPCLGNMYLFFSILAEFFTLYATQNSFHQLTVKDEETGEIFQWAAKRGCQPLL